MTYDQLTPDIREIAEQHLPPLQLEAWVLWLEAKSMRPERGIRWIAQQLDLDPSSVEGRLQRAKRNLRKWTGCSWKIPLSPARPTARGLRLLSRLAMRSA